MAKRFTTGMAQIEPRFILWQRVRFPLAIGVVLVLLVVSGLLLRSYLVSRGMRRDLARATELQAVDTFAAHREARELLETLRRDHPDDERIQTRLAWQRVLTGLRFGVDEPGLEEIRGLVGGLEAVEASCLRTASRAGLEALAGDLDQALETVGEEPPCREGVFVRGSAEARRGNDEQAMVLFDRARRGDPPFVPALAELVRVLRQTGRYPEARNALEVLTKAAPGHEDGTVQGVLLDLDANAADPSALSKLVGPLSKRVADVEIGDDAPRTVAQEWFAEGRLSFLGGDLAAAEKTLSRAAGALSKSQPVATWLATARRRDRRYDAALEAIEAFPDEPGTLPALLETRLKILLDLGRTSDARATLVVLEKAGGDVAATRARILVADGAGSDAVEALGAVDGPDHAEATLVLAEAHLRMGELEQASKVLGDVGGSDPVQACAAGLRYYIEGQTAKARSSLARAAKAGARCGYRLAGRLLLDAGIAEQHLPLVEKSLAARDDIRDRVLLGRLAFRVKGAAAARTLFEAVESAEPQAATVLRELAEAYHEMGAAEDAARITELGVERTKGHPLLLSYAARLARESESFDEAETLIETGLQKASKSPMLLHERAALLFDQRRYPEAEKAASDAMRPGPGFVDAACLRANAQLRRGDREAAQVDLRRNLAPSRRHSGVPAEAGIWACLVDFHLQRGPSALTRAKTAMYYLRRIPVESAMIEVLDGRVSRRDSRQSDANERFRKAISLDAANREAWRRLSKGGRLSAEEQARFEKLFPGQRPQDR